MILLRADEQLLEIEEPDEAEREAARRQRETGERQIGRNDEREDGEGQEDDDRRQHHDAARLTVDPLAEGERPRREDLGLDCGYRHCTLSASAAEWVVRGVIFNRGPHG